MAGQWIEREALIAVKTYPNPSKKHRETVCVAAITREEGWIRLYPVTFRSLPGAQQFQKFQRVQLRMTKHPRDTRPESFRPDQDSIRLLDVIDARKPWERWNWIEPTLSTSMCEIQRLQGIEGKSLGVFKPEKVIDFVIKDEDAKWSDRKQAALDQLTLFDPVAPTLEKIPYIFSYRYACSDEGCKGHTQSVIDWEIMALYRNVRRTANTPDEIKSLIRQKYLGELCASDRDTHFFVGNLNAHRASFMVLGVYWPLKRKHDLFD